MSINIMDFKETELIAFSVSPKGSVGNSHRFRERFKRDADPSATHCTHTLVRSYNERDFFATGKGANHGQFPNPTFEHRIEASLPRMATFALK